MQNMRYGANGIPQGQTSPVKSGHNNVDLSRIKVVVVGDGGTGKTSLLVVFTDGEFPEEYVPTVFENYTAEMMTEVGSVHLLLWDTAGQEDYDRLRPLSYDRADVIVLCYDVMSVSSFENISIRWAPEIRHFCPGTPCILVGCKTDLRKDTDFARSLRQQGRDPVTTQRGETMANDIGAVAFIECSAKDMDNVDEVFVLATQLAMGAGSKDSKSTVLFTNCSNCAIL